MADSKPKAVLTEREDISAPEPCEYHEMTTLIFCPQTNLGPLEQIGRSILAAAWAIAAALLALVLVGILTGRPAHGADIRLLPSQPTCMAELDAAQREAARAKLPLAILVTMPDQQCQACQTVHQRYEPILASQAVVMRVPHTAYPLILPRLRIAVRTFPTLIVEGLDGRRRVYVGTEQIRLYIEQLPAPKIPPLPHR